MLDVSVEQSRASRLERQKSRFRDRGGIFVPPTTNALRELLLARTITGESPIKKRRASKGLLEPALATTEKRKGKNNSKTGMSSGPPPAKKSETSKRKATLSDNNANKAMHDNDEYSELPVAGPSTSDNDSGALRKSSKTTSRTAGSKTVDPSNAPKRRGRPPKSRPVVQEGTEGAKDSVEDAPTQKPKQKTKPKTKPKTDKSITSAKKRRIAVDSDDEDGESDFEAPVESTRKRLKISTPSEPGGKLPSLNRSQAVRSSRTKSDNHGLDVNAHRTVGDGMSASSKNKGELDQNTSTTTLKGRQQLPSRAPVISDDGFDDGDEERPRSRGAPAGGASTSQKGKRQTSGASSRRKGKSDVRKKSGRRQSDSDSEDEELHAQDARALHAPKPGSRFQKGCTLPSIEEESEEEDVPAKSKPLSFFDSILQSTSTKRTEPPSVINRVKPLHDSLEQHTTSNSREQFTPPRAESKKRPREVDANVDELDGAKGQPLPTKPARKRAKTVTETVLQEVVPAVPKSASKKPSGRKGSGTSKTTVKNKSRKPSKPTKMTVVDEDPAKTPSVIHSRNLKENINTLTPSKAKPVKDKKSKASVPKGPPRSVLDRIRIAPPPPVDSDDDDPLNFLS